MNKTEIEQNWKRLVLKVGSALISPERNGCSSQHLYSIANFIVQCRLAGIQVVLVSSGSVAAGAHLFDEPDAPSITVKKAMAAAGQSEMMATWDRLFDFNTAQVLLTHADLRNRKRFVSVRETLDALLANDILPIVNENDAVTTDKLKVGDNDNLSAMVATAANADCLIICSDIDGFFDANPQLDPAAKLITDVNKIDATIYKMAGEATSSVGTGGMKTKIEAAEKAVSHGIDTYIVNGFKESSFTALLRGENPGTIFHPHKEPMHDQSHWMKHTTKVQGELVVNDEFSINEHLSTDLISPKDIVEVQGEFSAGEVVMLRKENGEQIAKVKSNYGSCLLDFVANQDSDHISEQLDKTDDPIVSKQFMALVSEKTDT